MSGRILASKHLDMQAGIKQVGGTGAALARPRPADPRHPPTGPARRRPRLAGPPTDPARAAHPNPPQRRPSTGDGTSTAPRPVRRLPKSRPHRDDQIIICNLRMVRNHAAAPLLLPQVIRPDPIPAQDRLDRPRTVRRRDQRPRREARQLGAANPGLHPEQAQAHLHDAAVIESVVDVVDSPTDLNALFETPDAPKELARIGEGIGALTRCRESLEPELAKS